MKGTIMKRTVTMCVLASVLIALSAGCEEASIEGTRTGWLENDISGTRGQMEVELSATPRLYLEAWPDGQEELKSATRPKRIVPVTEWGIHEVYVLDGGPNSDVATFQVLLENDHTCYPLLTIVDVQRTYYSQATVEVGGASPSDNELGTLRIVIPREDGTPLSYRFNQNADGSVTLSLRQVSAL
jgi:hypothetical protein